MTNMAPGSVGALGFDFHCASEERLDRLLISRRRVGLLLLAWGLAIGPAEAARTVQGRSPTADSDMITVDATSLQSDME